MYCAVIRSIEGLRQVPHQTISYQFPSLQLHTYIHTYVQYSMCLPFSSCAPEKDECSWGYQADQRVKLMTIFKSIISRIYTCIYIHTHAHAHMYADGK
ncbi:hypothetical protein BKA67DRAFT_259260 [Truncatella angustata]|uniref:Uncharacterized protein n=1 Tax=Truncatella angustata TaxID=152316 RepID=A0A9P8ZX56_9PEZI|nr:uncharacterized protein BKA67DRAFT_259260 [Truncatella angustata]KAH6653748.1 hypothetical protein BKA67DRAFT_259260 [Truncatella angustata]